MPNEQEYSISELANLAGVTPRTIRYYVSIGLLASPGQVGPGTRYGDGHLQRLRLIRKLQREHLPLGEIGTRLQGLDEDDVAHALEADGPAVTPGSALDYIRQLREGPGAGDVPDVYVSRSIAAPPEMGEAEPQPTQRSQWERIALSQNVELHIRKPLGRLEKKRVDRLIHVASELLEEDQS